MIEPNKFIDNSEVKGNIEEQSISPENQEVVVENQEQVHDNVAKENPVDLSVLQNSQTTTIDPQADEDEVVEEFSGKTDDDSKNWTQKAKDVIREYSDRPFIEDEKSEELQENYLKERFGVEVKDED